MRIYVASSWRNEFHTSVVEYLRSLGHEVYDFKNPEDNGNSGFSWAEIDPDWQNWTSKQYVKALSHPKAVHGFERDFNAMKWADCCVMVLPCNRSAHTEAGWFAGAGKKVYAYLPIPQEPELMYAVFDGIFHQLHDLKKITHNQEYPIIDGHRRHYVRYPVLYGNKWRCADVLLTGGYLDPFQDPSRIDFESFNECKKSCDIHNKYHGWSIEAASDIVGISMGQKTT